MMQYNLGAFGPDIPTPHDVGKPPRFQPVWDVIVGGSGGAKNVVEVTGRRDFGSFSATAGPQWRFYRFGRIAMGTDVTYDGSVGAITSVAIPLARERPDGPWALGVYSGYEHIIGRFSAFLHLGYNVVRGLDNPDVSRRLSAVWLALSDQRSHLQLRCRSREGIRRADALEVGAGYRLRWPFRN